VEGCGREVRLHDVVQIAHAPFTNLAGNVSNMSATCRRHVGDMAKCRLFLSRQGKFGDMVSCVLAHFCVAIFRH
jgi:hypothetical protein